MVLVRTTVATEAQARALADAVVDEGLAACVHLVPIRSTYEWKGRREEGEEWLVEARATPRLARRLAARLAQDHPYELPLVETLKSTVNGAYGAWARKVQPK